MSDRKITLQTEDGQSITTDYNGQLQIVEMDDSQSPTHMLPDSDENKYIQVLDPQKGLMQLDLLNFTLVKCNDDDNTYQVIDSNQDKDGDGNYQVVGSSCDEDTATITCVIEDAHGNHQFVNNGDNPFRVMNTSSDDDNSTITCVLSREDEDDTGNTSDSYVVLDGDQGDEPLVILRSSIQMNSQTVKKQEGPAAKKPLTPAEILEKAKAIQRAKAQLNSQNEQRNETKGRKRKGTFPPPMELLSSPNFKLFLYSCKQCSFKCNAIKEMSAHKASEHSSGFKPGRSNFALSQQCARCPYKAGTHAQLTKHVQEAHYETKVKLDDKTFESELVKAADILVCGACGFESGNRNIFKQHIQKKHGDQE